MKKIIEITSIEELMEMSGAGAASGYGGNAFKEIDEGGAGQTTVTPAHFKPKGKDMRQEIQTEMLMRQYVRNNQKTIIRAKDSRAGTRTSITSCCSWFDKRSQGNGQSSP